MEICQSEIVLAMISVEQFWEDLVSIGWIEFTAVLTGVIYVILATRQKIACWLFGIISSLLSIYLFLTGKLYAEAILYLFYVLAGIYGWYNWNKGKADLALPVQKWSINSHFMWCIGTFALALCLGYFMDHFTDAAWPYIDSQTTLFSFLATYLTTKKVLENWIYWIIIDLVSIGLYADRGFALYSILMLLYTILAVIGYLEWRKSLNYQQKENKVAV